MKRILTIQDISCIGKCSLTAALPIISAMGVETAILPTAVLSTHTMFKNPAIRDLTEDLKPIMEHWKREGFRFDAIYTGYLGSIDQINIVSDYIAEFGSDDTRIIIDPVMADNGRLYSGFDAAFAGKMADLCSKADIILPNISEASLMAGLDYPGENASEAEIKRLLDGLAVLGASVCIITGTSFSDGTLGFSGYDAVKNEYFRYGTKKVPYRSHGTGDIFASTFTGAVMNDFSVWDALKIAADYTCACISNTASDPERVSYGVNFEAEIPYLLKLIGK